MIGRPQGGSRSGGARYAAAVSLSAVTTLSLATGLSARYVPPSVVWWPQVVALALPVIGGVAVPSAVWSWRAARRGGVPGSGGRLAARSLASLQGALVLAACLPSVVGRAPVGPTSSAQSAPDSRGGEVDGQGRPRTLTVVSLNAGQAAGRPGPLADMIDVLQPDVVVLQEAAVRLVPVPDAPGGIAVATTPGIAPVANHASYRVVTPPVDPESLPAEGRVVRDPVFARVGRVGLPDPAGPAAEGGEPVRLGPDAAAGTYTRVVVEWGGRPVAVYSVHLRSFGSWRAAPRPPGLAGLVEYARRSLGGLRQDLVQRAAEAERLRSVLDAEPLPHIVAGDLNSTPSQWAYRRVADSALDALALEGGLFPRTFPARLPLFRIDAVLASPEFDVVGASVGPAGLSDHRPVIATLSLPTDTRGPSDSPQTGGSP